MSTRGAVAWRDAAGALRGVYNHSDSQPTRFGPRLLQAIGLADGIPALIAKLRLCGDWRELASRRLCPLCGKPLGWPCNITPVVGGYGHMASTREEFVGARLRTSEGHPELRARYEREIQTLDEVERNRAETGCPDPQGKWHDHERPVGAENPFDPFDDPLSMEWVYLLILGRNVIEVWHRSLHAPARQAALRTSGKLYRPRARPEVAYTHVFVEEVAPEGADDRMWGRIEARSKAFSATARKGA